MLFARYRLFVLFAQSSFATFDLESHALNFKMRYMNGIIKSGFLKKNVIVTYNFLFDSTHCRL